MKRTTWLIVGGVLLIALLAGGAFMGARLLAQKPQTSGSEGGMGPQGAAGHIFDMRTPAQELPQTPADEVGTFVRREDNSVFIGTGELTIMKGSSGIGSGYDGPVVEVVINQDTTIYRDTTMMHEAPGPSGDAQVQQTVVPGSIDDIGQNAIIEVWGNKTGDRIVAQVVVYDQPPSTTSRG